MEEAELIALLRLQKIHGLGPVRIRKLVGMAGSPRAVFETPELPKMLKMKASLIAGLKSEEFLKSAEMEFEFTRLKGIRCLSFLDSDYPDTLLNCDDAPLVLFTQGNINWQMQRILSVVGTREMTPYGRDFCQRLIEGISSVNPIVVSGFAFGVDICAQRAAMQYGLQTIGCLAHGLDRIYPEAHRRWVPEMVKNGGFITEFSSNTIPEPHNFIRRNRIIAGLAQATVVIESGMRGGSLVTADYAFGYNREVFAVPGRANDAFSEGCNELIRIQKAQLITSPEQLLEAMGWESQPQHIAKEEFIMPGHWSDLEKAVSSLLRSSERQNMDNLVRDLNSTVQQVSTAIFNLELQGFVKPLPAKFYSWKGR
jgi:DNA processing protein